MRLLALLFALYFTVLGCLPCADGAPRAQAAGPAPTATLTARHPDEGHLPGSSHGSRDWCSPLCQCHCCAGSVLPPASTVLLAGSLPVPHLVRRFAAQSVPGVLTRAPALPLMPPRRA